MKEIGPAPEAMSPEDIIARWGAKGGALDELIQAAKDPEHESERLIQINQARYNWRMVQGDQFCVPGFATNQDGQQYVDFVSLDPGGSGEPNGAQMTFAYPLNVIGGDCYKYGAVMGQSAPGVKAVADDAGDREDLRKANEADAVLREAWQKLLIDQLWRVVAFHQYTTGPTFIHTPYVTDAIKYGQSVEPQIQLVDDGNGGQIPVEGEPAVYANGDVECRIWTVLEVSGPFGTKTLEEWGWLKLEFMADKFRLLSMWPVQLGKYRAEDPPDDDMGSTETTASEARDSVSNPSGVGRPRKKNQWRFQQYYFRPWMYEAITDKEARETIKRQFPGGLWMPMVGSAKITLDERVMDDEWVPVKTGRGEKIFERPICSDSVPFQRALNDLGNLAVETVLRAIAKTVVDQMLFDRKSLASNEAVPAEVIFTTTALGTDISKMIAQIPPARVSDQLRPLFEMLRALQQDITGIRPELSGGGAPTQTYREAKQRKDQALMQLSPQAAEMQYAADRLGQNIVRQRAKYGSGTIKSKKKSAFGSKTEVVNLAELSETGWHCEADDNFPMTAADTFDKLYGLLKEFSPEIAQQLSLLDPMNLERNLEILQLPGYESTFEDQKQKTLNDIEQLMQGQPIQQPPGPDGQPAPAQPSIPVDQYDDHAFVADFMRKWMVAPEYGQEARAANPQGFANVEAFQQAHQQLAQPPAPPEAPPARAAINISGSPQEFGVEVLNEVLQGANLPGNVQALPAPMPTAPSDGGGDLNAPAPPEDQEFPLPPEMAGPEMAAPQIQ